MQPCGECTLCCTLFPVRWLEKPINTPCVHCDAGCMIHETKPAECSDFNCAYTQMAKENINLRPDKCGIIFEKLSSELRYGTVVPGMEISESAHRQIANFLAQGFSVVLSAIDKKDNCFAINEAHDEGHIRAQFRELVDGYLQH